MSGPTDAQFTGLLEAAAEGAVKAHGPAMLHPPLFMYVMGNGEMQTQVIPPVMLQHKDVLVYALKDWLRMCNASCYLFISEAWVSTPRHVPEDWRNTLAPSKDPERREAVVMYGVYPSRRKVLYFGWVEDGVLEPLRCSADTDAGNWPAEEDRFGTLLDAK